MIEDAIVLIRLNIKTSNLHVSKTIGSMVIAPENNSKHSTPFIRKSKRSNFLRNFIPISFPGKI